MQTILFGKRNCRQCKTIRSFLDAKEIEFTFVDIEAVKSSDNISESMRLTEASKLYQATDAKVWLFYNGEFHGYAKAVRMLEGIKNA